MDGTIERREGNRNLTGYATRRVIDVVMLLLVCRCRSEYYKSLIEWLLPFCRRRPAYGRDATLWSVYRTLFTRLLPLGVIELEFVLERKRESEKGKGEAVWM